MLETANAAFFTTIGGRERTRTGLPLGQLMPELVEQGFIALLDRVYRSGKPYAAREARVLLGVGADAREAFFDFTYEPRLDAGGNVMGVRVIGVETTQVKHAQRLTAEHRVLLEQIARQAPLPDVLEGMARAIEDLARKRCWSPSCWRTPTAAICAMVPLRACPVFTTRPSTGSLPARGWVRAAPRPTAASG
ncbi:PAS domain-containing protein [Streptomyces sp. NPDC005953]|uniref:PAS domain-containing protein n=1 Tax=Streptomyces sp. NPDC005953 TaxID=3156719 RepID=UPI0033F50E27